MIFPFRGTLCRIKLVTNISACTLLSGINLGNGAKPEAKYIHKIHAGWNHYISGRSHEYGGLLMKLRVFPST